MNYYNEIKRELINNEAYKKVKDYSTNRNELETYYRVGKLLIDAQGGEARAKYGDGLIKKYSSKLTDELGKGYSVRSLKYMRSFYLLQKRQTLSAKLTWSHYVELLKFDDINVITYYQKIAIDENLSVRDLRNRIKSNEYERLDDKTKQKLVKKEKLNIGDNIKHPITIINTFKTDEISEAMLKQLILNNIPRFMNELGNGFSFINSEYKIKNGATYNYIDLLLFNIEYNCYVVIELKITELKKEHIGQIMLYMNYIDKNIKKFNHDKTIGIIIAKRDNKFVMEYCSDERIIEQFINWFKKDFNLPIKYVKVYIWGKIMNDIKKVYNRLIKLSEEIIDIFKVLSNLSYMNRENTDQFLDQATDLERLLEQERIILFNLKPEQFKELCEYLVDMNDYSQAYARTLALVCDFFDERYESKKEIPTEYDDEIDDYSYEEEIDEENDKKEITDIIDEFYTDEEDMEKYSTTIMNYVATRVIKNMYERIKNTYTDNDNDKTYQKRMLKYFKQFKYYYFMLNNKLEILGLNYLFDLDKIEIPSLPEISGDIEPICYNECITILEALYNLGNNNKSIEGISIALFNMMMFDIYIDNIDSDKTLKLIDLCDLIGDKDNNFYGNIAKNKLVKKLKKD